MTEAHRSADPKAIAADIAREYREDASRWTQGAFARAAPEDSYDGEQMGLGNPLDSRAVCWCLRGAIDKRTGNSDSLAWPTYQAFDEALGYAVGGRMLGDNEPLWFVRWNDAPGRTVGEVIELCEKVARGY